jgi:hypothetical protein
MFMRSRLLFVASFAAVLCVGASEVACTPTERAIVKGAIDVTTAICALQHSEDPNVNAFCHVEESKADDVKKLIGAQRDVLAKARTDFAMQRTTPCDGKR